MSKCDGVKEPLESGAGPSKWSSQLFRVTNTNIWIFWNYYYLQKHQTWSIFVNFSCEEGGSTKFSAKCAFFVLEIVLPISKRKFIHDFTSKTCVFRICVLFLIWNILSFQNSTISVKFHSNSWLWEHSAEELAVCYACSISRTIVTLFQNILMTCNESRFVRFPPKSQNLCQIGISKSTSNREQQLYTTKQELKARDRRGNMENAVFLSFSIENRKI